MILRGGEEKIKTNFFLTGLAPHLAQIEYFYSNMTCFIDKWNGYLSGRRFVLSSIKLLCLLSILDFYHLAHLAEHIFHLNVSWLAE